MLSSLVFLQRVSEAGDIPMNQKMKEAEERLRVDQRLALQERRKVGLRRKIIQKPLETRPMRTYQGDPVDQRDVISRPLKTRSVAFRRLGEGDSKHIARKSRFKPRIIKKPLETSDRILKQLE